MGNEIRRDRKKNAQPKSFAFGLASLPSKKEIPFKEQHRIKVIPQRKTRQTPKKTHSARRSWKIGPEGKLDRHPRAKTIEFESELFRNQFCFPTFSWTSVEGGNRGLKTPKKGPKNQSLPTQARRPLFPFPFSPCLPLEVSLSAP